MFIVVLIGTLCVIGFICTCGIMEEILIRLINRNNSKGNNAPAQETPEQLIRRKCCNCPAFSICTKGIEELMECDG